MKSYDLILGIDVSKLKLDCIGVDHESTVLSKHCVIENKRSSIKAYLLKLRRKFGNDILVAFEDTGVYGMNLAYILTDLSVDYCQLSALEVHRSMG